MKKNIVNLLLFLIFPFIIQAQQKHPTDAFVSPLDIPLLLSGNFGELRNNHFHAGLDFKTQGREGLSVYAAAQGYVSRIKVGLYGYGKVIYITHPNGYTSVYAHLQKFSPEIEKYVKQRQYAKKTFEIELFPKVGELPVNQKQLIGLSGNTGSSGGPHLHFEIRDADSKALNPLWFGYEIADNQPPAVYQLWAYSLDNKTQINGSQVPQSIHFTKQPDGSFLAESVTAEGFLGLGIQAIDRQDLTYHNNGVYKVTLQLNGTTQLQYVFDQLDFQQGRYINTFIDYQQLIENKSRTQLLYKTKSNPLKSIYSVLKNDGKLEILDGLSYMATVIVEDFNKNQTRIDIPITGKKSPITEQKLPEEGKLLVAKRDQYFTLDKANVYFPVNTFYEDFLIQIENKNDTIRIHHPKIPVHRFYNLTIENTRFAAEELPKVFIAYVNEKNKIAYENTVRKGQTFSTRTRNLGTFVLMKDDIVPEVTPINFKNGAWVTDNTLQVAIKDELSGIAQYTATLNGAWVLFEYEAKKGVLTFDFSDIDTSKTDTYQLELKVADNVGNEQVLKMSFRKK
ncbi:M23 family metallopeptidase [Capnocytophaga canimorsus]|uniref:M23 family metallopeptidase n=1 Tax=Capnocytophaga canimorsus TaxID=28188 RepID=UPI00385A86C9